MATLLRIDSSASQSSNSKYLAEQYQNKWLANHAEGTIINRDLSVHVPNHISEAMIGAMYTPAESRSEEQIAHLANSEQYLAELKAADTLLISVPMYNFGIPSTLKAYLDHIARVGETFVYTENGPKGLLEGKQAVIILTSGGNYTQSPLSDWNHVTPYLKTLLNFIGISDIEIIVAPNMSGGEADKQASLNQAEQTLMAVAV